MTSVGTTYGIGRHRAEIPAEDYINAMKYEVIGQAFCIFNIAISKAAVAFFLLRIVNKKWHKGVVWFILITNTIMATWTTIAVLIQCVPIERVWDISVPGNCWLDFAKVGITCSGTLSHLIRLKLSRADTSYPAYAVAVDFVLALAPCFVIWELNMKKKDKLVTISGLSLGVL
jgi:hypothetical protein